jgi:hypothetical protein
MRTDPLLKWAMAAVLGITGTSVAQVKAGETIQVGGGTYTVIDRVQLPPPTGFSRPTGGPIPYTPGEMCLAPGAADPSAVDPFRLADGQSTGLLAAIVKMRLVGPPRLGTQNYGGTIEFALLNPCPEPIAVPIVEAETLHEYLPKEGRFEAIQVSFTALAGGDGLDAEFRGGYALAGSPRNEKTYRILKQGEAVVLVAPIDFGVGFAPQRELEHALQSLRLTAGFGKSYWNGNGQISTHGNGWSIVCDHESVPVELAK